MTKLVSMIVALGLAFAFGDQYHLRTGFLPQLITGQITIQVHPDDLAVGLDLLSERIQSLLITLPVLRLMSVHLLVQQPPPSWSASRVWHSTSIVHNAGEDSLKIWGFMRSCGIL